MPRNTSVTLGDHFDQFVAEILQQGRFQSVKLFGQACVNLKLTKQNSRQGKTARWSKILTVSNSLIACTKIIPRDPGLCEGFKF
jgi:antitoxin ParD1/3/4